MGNDASKNLKRAMTIKRGGRGSDTGDEYSAIDIREKYERMPKVSVEERMIIKSSWRIIQNKVIARVCEFNIIWDYKTDRNNFDYSTNIKTQYSIFLVVAWNRFFHRNIRQSIQTSNRCYSRFSGTR